MEQNIGQNIGQNPNLNPNPGNKKSLVIIIIGAIVVLAALGIWYWKIQTPSVPEKTSAPQQSVKKEDSTSAIDQELNSIDIGDLNAEFQTIDTDLNSL